MSDFRPGLNHRRLANLMEAAIERCQLDLSDAIVLTEAASGAYVVTPVLAAMAGAKQVFAMTRMTQYGTVENIAGQTYELARVAAVESRIEIVTGKTPEIVGQADIITNSGHLRPIDANMISWMKPTAVIPLMYEAWEFRPGDVNLTACRHRGILVAGTNERHPSVDVFSFLGMMSVKLLMDAGIAVYSNSVLLLCDNPFGPFIESGLIGAGATVDRVETLSSVTNDRTYDALLVALRPGPEPVLSAKDAVTIRDYWPGAVVAQFWGDIDRSALSAAAIPYWPIEAPAPGHMGILPSALGPEPIVRLQAGGLKVGELLLRRSGEFNQRDLEFLQVLDTEQTNDATR